MSSSNAEVIKEIKFLSKSIVRSGFDEPTVLFTKETMQPVLVFPSKDKKGFHAVAVTHIMGNYFDNDRKSIGELYSIEDEPARSYVHDLKFDEQGNLLISDHVDKDTEPGIRNDKWLRSNQITDEVLNDHVWTDGFDDTSYSVFEVFRDQLCHLRFAKH